MTYLSRLILNPRSRWVRNELADPYEMHRTVMKAFADANFEKNEPSGVLFRVELPRTGIPTLLVQSLYEPNWSAISEPQKNYLIDVSFLSFGEDALSVKKVDFSQKLRAGQKLSFRLRANPTKRFSSGKGNKPGKRVGLYEEKEQIEWLERKLSHENAAKLLSAYIVNETESRGKLFIQKENAKRMKFLSVQFEGILQINDRDQFLKMLEIGIGSGKGMGFGLLSLAPGR